MIKSKILNLFFGRPLKFRDQEFSSIARKEVEGSIRLSKDGLDGDQVADTKNHGGPDKALHLYPYEHYQYWRNKLGAHQLLDQAGAFGENISALGLCEDKVKIGDRFAIGQSIIEISHGRQPCWKIEHHFDRKNMVVDILRNGNCGIYFRVLQEGVITKGDTIDQIYSPNHQWTVLRVFEHLFFGQHKTDKSQASLHQLMALDSLADAWKKRVQSLIL